MKRLLDYIAKKAKKRKTFFQSEEYRFFLDNRHYLSKMPRFLSFYDANDSFSVMRANIILYSYLNKVRIESEIKNLKGYINTNNKNNHANFLKSLHETIAYQPYYQDEQYKIYMPFFNRALNQTYLEEPEKLLTYPYNGLMEQFSETLVDPFDTYGSELYNSHFSRLVKIASCEQVTAFFHYDTNAIYFINDQGRLDASIVLFDRYIRHPSYSHMLERIRPVVDAYFNYSREDLIKALHDNGFISNHLLRLVHFHDWTKL